jgi:transposase
MRKSRLNSAKQAKLIEHFVAGTTARFAADLIGVNRNTAAYYFQRLRKITVYQLEQESHEVFAGEIEVDESYFGGTRKGKRGRGSAGKVPVFGLLKRGGKVYTKIIADASGQTLMPIIEHKVIPDSIVYSDSWRGYNVLDISDFKHYELTIQNYSCSQKQRHDKLPYVVNAERRLRWPTVKTYVNASCSLFFKVEDERKPLSVMRLVSVRYTDG